MPLRLKSSRSAGVVYDIKVLVYANKFCSGYFVTISSGPLRLFRRSAMTLKFWSALLCGRFHKFHTYRQKELLARSYSNPWTDGEQIRRFA